MKTLVAAVLPPCAPLALAQDLPVPKMFKGMQGDQVWMASSMDGVQRRENASAEAGCKHQLLKDTADEAVVESHCKERKSTATMKRESDKSMLMTVDATGPRGRNR